METLGKSIIRLPNGGAKLVFWAIVIMVFFMMGFLALTDIEIDQIGITLLMFCMLFFICPSVYMFFQSKTEVDLRENGICVRRIGKNHEIKFDDIAELDKTKRIGKRGRVIIIFYLFVIEKNDGVRITFPFKVSDDFIANFIKAIQ